jgi:dihydrofolate reductase
LGELADRRHAAFPGLSGGEFGPGAIPGRHDLDEGQIQRSSVQLGQPFKVFGRVTYEMMEAAWRGPARTGARPDWLVPFARTIDGAKKYVVSGTLDRVDWNAELVRGDLGKAVQQLKREPGKGLFVGGVKLPLALADLGLIDEYEFIVQPILAGHGPTLFAGLSERLEPRLVGRQEFRSGAVALRYQPSRVTA